MLPSGVTFNGLSTAKHPTTGDGQLIYPDGSIYKGAIRKGQPHGHGEKVWAIQAEYQKTYVGNWLNGSMEGFGELHLQTDELYIGHFSQNLPHG